MENYTRLARKANQLRETILLPDFLIQPEGSVIIQSGLTKVICNASVEEKVPPFLKGKAQGWITAEYGMLPRSTTTRMKREAATGKQTGRTLEIQRLIGRSLRAVVDLHLLGERQITIDCDVIQADGGTRTASITGAFVAVNIAINKLLKQGMISENPIKHQVAAISVGVVNQQALLDLDYIEDSGCDSDLNVVMSADGKIVEIQGTAEKATFAIDELSSMLDLAQQGIERLFELQQQAIKQAVI